MLSNFEQSNNKSKNLILKNLYKDIKNAEFYADYNTDEIMPKKVYIKNVIYNRSTEVLH